MDASQSPPAGKRAQQVADAIEAQIVGRRWPVGEVLGSEPELLEEHGVSRSVLREAVRILENHGVAEMRKGRGGGLTVRRPEVAPLARAAALYLDHQGATDVDLVETRLGLELTALDAAVANLDAGGRIALEEHAERERLALAETGLAPEAHSFHRLLVRLSHNPVLGLCTEMLLALQLEQQRTVWPDDRVPTLIARRSVDAHREITDAILAGDRDAAHAALRGHLGALAHGRATSICREPHRTHHQSAL